MIQKTSGFNEKYLIPTARAITPAMTLLGAAALISEGIARPLAAKIKEGALHRSVLNKIVQSYPEEKHALVRDVFDFVAKSSPNIISNYLLAKTVVDQQMAHIESISGSVPSGIQVSLPTVQQAIDMSDSLLKAKTQGRKVSMSDVYKPSDIHTLLRVFDMQSGR